MERLVGRTVVLLITYLFLAVATHATKPSMAIESSKFQIYENGRFVDDKQMNDYQNSGEERMSVNDQISVLSRQLNMLTSRRSEDYQMLERSLHSYVQKHLEQYLNVDIKKELKDLRWAIDYTGIWNGKRVSCNENSEAHFVSFLSYFFGV